MGDNADNNGGDYGYYDQMQVYLCPSWALSLGYLGVASGAVLSNWGSAVSYIFFIITRHWPLISAMCCLPP